MINPSDFKLCYVTGCWAYFTTQDLDKQWGDDWNDAPYEHNAGEPYSPQKSYSRATRTPDGITWEERSDYTDGEPNWVIKKVAFDGWWDQPCENHLNSPYSVQSINKGAVAWLYNPSKKVAIPAGTDLVTFYQLIREGDGEVYSV